MIGHLGFRSSGVKMRGSFSRRSESPVRWPSMTPTGTRILSGWIRLTRCGNARTHPPVQNGCIAVPSGPGLGLDLLPGIAQRADATVRRSVNE